MVVQQPSKLRIGVRFPLPAPNSLKEIEPETGRVALARKTSDYRKQQVVFDQKIRWYAQ